MLQARWCAALTLALTLGSLGEVEAAPMKLSFWSNVGATSSPQPWDLEATTDGFPGFVHTRLGGSFSLGYRETLPLVFPVEATFSLYDENDHWLIDARMSGMVEGSLYRPDHGGMGGGTKGTLTAADAWSFGLGWDPLTGVRLTPEDIPAWFYDLSVTFDSRMTGGISNIFEVTWTVPPATQVPEPGTAVVFLVAAGGCWVVRRLRAGGREARRGC